MENVLFREKQRFTQFWLWVLLLGLAAVFWSGFIYQVVLGGLFGNNPLSDIQLSVMLALIGFGLPFFFYCMSLSTVVLPGMVQVRFKPFHLKPVHIPLHTVRHFEKVTYNAIGDYGGWGIRVSAKGKAYNTSGNQGVLLHFYDRKSLLIGSQRPTELFMAIERGKMPDRGSTARV